jgi:SAM-dependent methyltransferase
MANLKAWGATPGPFRRGIADRVRESLDRRRRGLDQHDAALVRQASWLERVDVARQNARYGPSDFGSLHSYAVSSAHFDHPDFLRWEAVISARPEPVVPPLPFKHRKMWEFALILAIVDRCGLYRAGARGIGFGVGSEPLAAAFARGGVDVVATDQPADQGRAWDRTGQLMHGLANLSYPHIVDDEELARRVTVRPVDMNELPADLGQFDFTWSSCVIEHLGSPALGLEFVRKSASLLRPGGVGIHTTEMELVPRETTMDYGHCAVYRPDDLLGLEQQLLADGFDVDFNLHVPMDSPEDRFISPANPKIPDPSHLKLAIGDSISTSFGIVVRRPG